MAYLMKIWKDHLPELDNVTTANNANSVTCH